MAVKSFEEPYTSQNQEAGQEPVTLNRTMATNADASGAVVHDVERQGQRQRQAEAAPCRALRHATCEASLRKFLPPATAAEWPSYSAAASASEQPIFVSVSIPSHCPIPPT